MTAYVLVAVAAVLSVLGWGVVRAPGHRTVLGAAVATLTALAAVAASIETPVAGDGSASADALLVLGTLLVVAGGGVVVPAVLSVVDHGRLVPADESMDEPSEPEEHSEPEEPPAPSPPPEEVLRGGAWIGALERLAVLLALAARWPEGIAVVLAVKGLGRYPELRDGGAGAAERFIIGTLASLVWAGTCSWIALGPDVALVPGLR